MVVTSDDELVVTSGDCFVVTCGDHFSGGVGVSVWTFGEGKEELPQIIREVSAGNPSLRFQGLESPVHRGERASRSGCDLVPPGEAIRPVSIRKGEDRIEHSIVPVTQGG